MYEKVFSRGRIGGCITRNRVILSPMDNCLGQASGEVSQRGIEYYAAKAKGGSGLVIVGYVGVIGPELGGVAMSGQTFLKSLDDRHAMSILCDRVHEYGGRVFIQLNHPGRKTTRAFNKGYEPVSASAMTPQLEKARFAPCHELTVDEIHTLEGAFATAAEHAYYAGADGVEIHCAHAYLFHQFLNPTRNARTDEYGGSMENRCRIVVETIEKIRKLTPASFPVTLRVHLFDGENMEGELSIEDMLEITQYLEGKGVDAFHFSVGVEERTGAPDMRFGWRNEYFKRFKDVLHVPIYGPNETKTPEEAESMLDAGVCDFVVMGRQHSADPEWCNKASSGHAEDIRPCISCNWCLQRVTADQTQIRCAVNPRLGRESLFPGGPAPVKKRVVIVGGGPAGLEAARTAADRGHQVTLLEKSGRLGGTLRMAAAADFKADMKRYLDWSIRTVEQDPRIILRLNTEATPELLRELKPDAILLAAGAKPILPRISTCPEKAVWVGELEEQPEKAGKRVVIAGAGFTGLEMALNLARKGRDVTVIDLLPEERIGADGIAISMIWLKAALQEAGVRFLCRVRLEDATPQGAVVSHEDGSKETLPCDTVVLSLGVRPDRSLEDAAKDLAPTVLSIGDCGGSGGTLFKAVSGGYDAAMSL